VDRLKARILLDDCTGRDIWSVELCRQRGIPDAWIEELADCYESGFRHDRQTIYEQEKIVHQYFGVKDVQLACRLAEYLGVDVAKAIALQPTSEAEVRALKEAVDE
jgi:hypothetical protein